jgi:hypothetical protein
LRVLRGIFGPEGENETGGWRKLRNGSIYTTYTSTNIVRVLNLKTIRWPEYVTCMGRWEMHFPSYRKIQREVLE